MGRNLRNQNTLIYVVDSESKQLIRDTLLYDYGQYGDRLSAYSAIYGGTMSFDITIYYEDYVDKTFTFDENRITELGYDYSSITGNVIKASYDSGLDAYLYPSVAIIYMSKLK